MSFRLLRRQGGFGPAPGRGEPLRDVPKDLCRPKTPQPCEPRNAAESAKQEKLGALQQAAESGYEVNLQPMKPEEIAKAAAGAAPPGAALFVGRAAAAVGREDSRKPLRCDRPAADSARIGARRHRGRHGLQGPAGQGLRAAPDAIK